MHNNNNKYYNFSFFDHTNHKFINKSFNSTFSRMQTNYLSYKLINLKYIFNI